MNGALSHKEIKKESKRAENSKVLRIKNNDNDAESSQKIKHNQKAGIRKAEKQPSKDFNWRSSRNPKPQHEIIGRYFDSADCRDDTSESFFQ